MSQVDLFTGAKLQCQGGVTVLTDVEAATATTVFFCLVSLQPESWWSSGGCLTSLLCTVTCRHPMSVLHPFVIPRKVLVTESYIILLYSVQFLCRVRFAEVVLY